MIWQLLINGLISGSIYALLALGFSLIYGTVRFFHFAHGAVCAAGAYITFWISSQFGIPLLPSAAVGVLAAGVLGVSIETLVYWPLIRAKSPSLVLLLASFGVFVFFTNFLQVAFGSDVRSLRTGPVHEGYHIFNAIVTGNQIVISVVCLTLTLALVGLLKLTRLGKAIRAVADDQMAAGLVGIHSESVIRTVFFIGSMLAGVAGVLFALETDLQPGMGLNSAIKGIIAAVIGGVGSIPGALFGGLLLGLAENLGTWCISTGWKDAISFSVLILFLLIRPSGLFGKAQKDRRV